MKTKISKNFKELSSVKNFRVENKKLQKFKYN